jgi:uncharacterized protein (TIGR04552 family)
MAVERISTSPGVTAEVRLRDTTLADLEAVRLLLRGGSVVDWHRLDFRDHNEVDRFLRVNEFDPTSQSDRQRLEFLRAESVEYLQRSFGMRIPDDIAGEIPVRDLFLLASRRGKRQLYSCVVLKVMHIIHHLAGRELLFKAPISDDEIFHIVEKKVVGMVEEIRGAGHPIVEFGWSRKPRDSLITKLLAKRSTLASNVYDKLRFRLIVRERADLLPLLVELTHRLIPFNYVVPGESVNDILDFRRIAEESPILEEVAAQLQEDPEPSGGLGSQNEFSGPGYRVINFVADMPVRLDGFLCTVDDPSTVEQGAIVFVLTEFQLLDARQAQENETGENSHERYKERQHDVVKRRLLRGMAPERASTANGDGHGDGHG